MGGFPKFGGVHLKGDIGVVLYGDIQGYGQAFGVHGPSPMVWSGRGGGP